MSSRANLAHEHPTDLDSSPSSPSSGIPAFLEPRRRSKPASRHRSRTTADDSSSSHLLARLVSREEELREVNTALVVTSERLETEASRANAAERRALDYFHRLRAATESRERAEQESARLREELKLYKLQLENAQKEIFRAQDIIDQVASQRNEAEADAARARTKARKLQEEKLVMLAREEGRRMGYKEGLSIGRRIGYDEGRARRLTGPSDRLPHHPLSLEDYSGDENVREQDEGITDEEHIDPRSRFRLRSAASIRQPPYVNDCVLRSFLRTLITERAPNRHRLYVHSKLPHMRPHCLSHRALILSACARLLMNIVRLLHLMTLMNQKLFSRYRSALAPSYIPSPSTCLTTDGSQRLILAHPTSSCHPRTNCSNPSPLHPVPLRPRSKIVDLRINKSRPLSGRATMLIRRPFRSPFRFRARPLSHPVLRPISRNMIL